MTPLLTHSISSGQSTPLVNLQVTSEHEGGRFDHFLVQCVPEISRTHLVQSIRQGLLTVDGKQKKSSYRLKVGENISGTIFQPPPLKLIAQKVPFDVLLEDEYLLILSKPPGIVVHPASGNPEGTLVNGLLYHCQEIEGVGEEIRPGIVHRLDKDTSGIMVVAKTEKSHRLLVDAFKARSVDKEYLALVHGTFRQSSGRIVAPIGRHPVSRQKMTVVEEGRGRYAVSNWELVEKFDSGVNLIRVHIETGRTHQIRVHMASLGHPVAGDTLYGRARHNRFPRQMLHAHRLSFAHPITGEVITVSAPLWPDFQQILNTLRGNDT